MKLQEIKSLVLSCKQTDYQTRIDSKVGPNIKVVFV